MLKPSSVQQLLQVIARTQQLMREGFDVKQAFSKAKYEVADFNDVKYQTIQDGCTRRLTISSIEKFYGLMQKTVAGNPEPLKEIIKSHSARSAHDEIEEYFTDLDRAARWLKNDNHFDAKQERPLSQGGSSSALRLSPAAFNKLKAIAACDGVDVAKAHDDLVCEAIDARFADLFG